MGEVWSEDAAFGELRSRLNGQATFKAFLGIWKLLEQAEEHAPGVYAQRWASYVEGELARWPSRVRQLEVYEQDEAAAYAAKPWSGVVGGLALFNLDLGDAERARWVAEGLRADFAELEHLEFHAMSVRKASVQRACDSGAFDGLTSLSFAQCAFKVGTLDVLLARLEERGEVTHLGFPGSMTQKTVERLFTSPLAATLTHLDLSSSPGLKTRGVKALAEHAHVFEKLEVLSLSGTKTSSVTAGEFARADWAPSFRFIDLRSAHSKGDGVLAFLDAGKLELLCPPDEDMLLDLRWFQIRDDELARITSHPELARVKGLSLYGNSFKHIEPLLASEHLGALHTLDVSSNRLDSPAQAVLDLVSKTTPRRLGLSATSVFEDADVAALCALEAAQGIEEIDLLGSAKALDFGPEALDAVLELEERGRLATVTFGAVAPEGDPVLERARDNGKYHVGPKVNDPGMFSVWRLDRTDPE